MARGSKKKKEIKTYARDAIFRMLKWAQEEYKLNDKINDPVIKITFSKKRDWSEGGWIKNKEGKWRPYLNIRLNPCLNFKSQTQKEYDLYSSDPVIGNKWVASWKAWLRFEVSHEVAH